MIEREDGTCFIGGTRIHMEVTDILKTFGDLINAQQEAASDESVLALLNKKCQLEGFMGNYRRQLNEYEMLVVEGKKVEDMIESTINDCQRSVSLAEKKIRA